MGGATVRLSLRTIGASDPLVHAIVQGLGDHNALWYRENPSAPNPIERVRYVPDRPAAAIELVDAPTLVEDGQGSCGSLAAALYGYLRGRQQTPLLITRRRNPSVWHVVVRLTDGQIWDPMHG